MGSWPRPSLQPPGEKDSGMREIYLLRSWAAEALMGHKRLRDGTAELDAAQRFTGYVLPCVRPPSHVLAVSGPTCLLTDPLSLSSEGSVALSKVRGS